MWTEKYSPQDLNGVAGHGKLKSLLRKYIERGDIPNLLFYGMQGTGKTILAEIIGHELLGEEFDLNFICCDSSNDRSIGKIRPVVTNALRNATINGYLRLMLFDEVDGLMEDAQKFLRGAMNNYNNTRFIFTCNEISKILEPLQDRFMCFEFKALKKDVIMKRLIFIRDNEKVEIKLSEIERIAKESNGSMRNAITELEKASLMDNDEEEVLNRCMRK